jgi:class 3 adenylate cyclase
VHASDGQTQRSTVPSGPAPAHWEPGKKGGLPLEGGVKRKTRGLPHALGALEAARYAAYPCGVAARAELPSGTVTFLFTDIEGSTRLLQELGERYGEVLAEHRRLIRQAFQRHGGVEVDTQGDAFFVAFARASDAVAGAQEAQAALQGGPVRVRMGLHTGEPIRGEEGYVGVDVHRGARVAAAGHGGQVLLSQATRDLLDSSFDLVDLGLHRLKDLTSRSGSTRSGASSSRR